MNDKTVFKNYGKYGNVYGHDIIILDHPEENKRKRRMCRCGCRKKASHIQYCNGVGMNDGCEKSLNEMAISINKQKKSIKDKSDKLIKMFDLDKLEKKGQSNDR